MDQKVINQNITKQNVRSDIIGELEAINQYENHLEVTDDLVAKQTINDILHEEKLHVGQLFGLLFQFDPDSKKEFEAGYQEFLKDNN